MVQSSSDLLALLAQVGEDGVDAVLVDGAQGGGGNAELDPTVLRSDPEAALVEVGLEATTGLAVGMRDVVAGRRALAGDLADFGHCAPRWCVDVARSPGDGGPGAGAGRRCRTQRAAHYAGKSLCGQALGCMGARHGSWAWKWGQSEVSRSVSRIGCISTPAYFCSAPAPAMYARTCVSSTGSGTEPCDSTASWNLRTSNLGPSAASASRRRRM